MGIKRPGCRATALLLACLLLTGCASGFNLIGEDRVQNPFENLRNFAKKDAAAAIARTEAYLKTPQGRADQGAPYRLRCYKTLHAHLSEAPEAAPAVAPVAGLIDGFELAAEAVNAQAGGGLIRVPEAVKADCRYVEDEIKRYALGKGLKFALPVGGGAAENLLRR